MKKLIIFSPILIALASIFYHYSLYEREYPIRVTIIPLGAILCFIFLIFILLKLTKKDFKKLITLFSSSLFLFFSYGYFYEFLKGYKIGEIYIFRHRILLLIWIILFILLLFLSKKNRLRSLLNICNVILCILIISAMINIYNSIRNINYEQNQFSQIIDNNQRPFLKDNEAPQHKQPDIYYIILDSYANPHILENIYDFNNQEFLDYLSQKGFYVAWQSRSNYASTLPSLSSSLNMDYHEVLDKDMDGLSYNKMIINNKVKYYLKERGYEYINLSDFQDKTDRTSFNLSFRYKMMDEFTTSLIRTTMCRPLYDYFVANDIYAEKALWVFRKLNEISTTKTEKPKFVFLHSLPPHSPFVFNEDKKEIKKETINAEQIHYKEKYVKQLVFINKQLEKFIDQAISSSGERPVIILQADHGPASTFSADTDKWSESPRDEMILERMSIFNAYYLPSNNQEGLYDKISPVNSFRLILNKYFNTNYEFLNDESYYSTYARPDHFINVTNILNSQFDLNLNY